MIRRGCDEEVLNPLHPTQKPIELRLSKMGLKPKLVAHGD